MLAVRDVARAMGRRRVLDGVELDVARGMVCVLYGENGAGKTTLLEIAAGVLPAHRGSICIDGFDIRDRRARARIGYGPAAANIPEHLAVYEWLDLMASLRGVSRREVERCSRTWAVDRLFGLRLGMLSLGERRRVVLATAELGDPALLLLDEPTVGLDAAAHGLLLERLCARIASGQAALVASHDAELVSSPAFTVRTLRQGRILTH